VGSPSGIQSWNAHRVVADALVLAARSQPDACSSVVWCANTHASLLGVAPRFDAAMVRFLRDPAPRPFLVYRLARGAAVALAAIDAPERLVSRGLFVLTSAHRFTRGVWMNAELFDREGSAPCLCIGILRDTDAGTLPTLDRTFTQPHKRRRRLHDRQLVLSIQTSNARP
jgi:hypothetical protein